MSSGVTVSTLAKTVYEEVKKVKKYRYIIYHIKDEKVIDVESTGPREATYQEFLENLQNFKTDCRYCVFDFPAPLPAEVSSESMSVDRLVLMTCTRGTGHDNHVHVVQAMIIMQYSLSSFCKCKSVFNGEMCGRCPEAAKVKQKMLYSSSYDALKKALVGVYKYIQACDFEEVSQEAIEDAFRKGSK
ncbi:DSTN [Cordylochernes scorpioides]|uniref:DSTN n=1 Tax=Cordylochernes scorpioides TaxID=51811 RepID=A0ABY6K6Z3_9ARAC|nr:DSTN [Cordylochernes scorpioides]